MDSPFHHHFGATIEGKNVNVLKRGQTITLTCRVIQSDGKSNNEHSKHIDWMKDGELVDSMVTLLPRKWNCILSPAFAHNSIFTLAILHFSFLISN
jgi:hypothetical protein